MGQSHVNRRRRELRPLRRLRDFRAALVGDLCSQLDIEASRDFRELVVRELVALSNPHVFPDRDAPIPAQRDDLARTYTMLRLRGILATQSEINAYLRSSAPLPDDDFRPGVRPFGHPTSDQARSAHAAQRRRQTAARRSVTI